MRYFTCLLFLFYTTLWSQTTFEKSEKLYVKENFASAKTGFETVLKQNPNHLKTIQYLGEIACHLKSWDQALFYFGRLKNIRPTQADYYYLYGGALALKATSVNKFKALGMINDIRESFEKAIELNPKHIEARWALIEYYIQLPYLLGGGENKAMRYANELTQLSPVDGYLSKGHIAEHYGHIQDAEKYYLKAVEVGQSATAYKKLAHLYNKMNQPEKAKTILESYSKRKG